MGVKHYHSLTMKRYQLLLTQFILGLIITNFAFAQIQTPPERIHFIFETPESASFNQFETPESANFNDFQVADSKIASGKSSINHETPQASDIIGNLAVLAFKNYDGRYNYNDFKIEKGTLSDASGQYKLEAFRVSPPTHAPTEFFEGKSDHGLFYKFSEAQDYMVYALKGNELSVDAKVKTEDVKIGAYTYLTNLNVSSFKEAITYVILPSSQEIPVSTSKLLPGKSLLGDTPRNEDKIGDLLIMGLKGVDGRYNYNDFKVEQGILSDETGKYNLEAFRVFPPTHEPTEFYLEGTDHGIFYKFSKAQDYILYKLAGDELAEDTRIKAEDIKVGDYTLLTGLGVSTFKETTTYVILPSSEEIPTSFAKILPGKTKIATGPQTSEINSNLMILGLGNVDGRYNYNNYKVIKGSLQDDRGDFKTTEAYQIFEPTTVPTEFFTNGTHAIFFKFPEQRNYNVYELNGEQLKKVAEVNANEVKIDDFTQVPNVAVNTISGSRTYFYAPNEQRISIFHEIEPGVEAARVKDSPLGAVSKFQFLVQANPTDVTSEEIRPQHMQRYFFPMSEEDGSISVIYQDTETSEILLTKVSADFKEQETTLLYGDNQILYAATKGENGDYYYITSEKGELKSDVRLVKINLQNQTYDEIKLDPSKDNFDFYNIGIATLEYHEGTVYMVYARTMNKSGDGLNHQASGAALFDAETLEVKKLMHNICSHSFDEFVSKNSQGEFIGLNAGDNYPRGTRLHKFKDGGEMQSKVVYTYKTQHADNPGSGRPQYAEISGNGKTYYKWSNDNSIYSELGAVLEVSNGYVVIISGEPNAQGRSLDNSRVGDNNTDPRNLGFVKVRKDFENATGGSTEVTDDLVLTKGLTEEGVYYSYGGSEEKQRNAGMVWLTNERDKENWKVTHIKATVLKDGNILILWENYKGNKYDMTYGMKVDASGNILQDTFELGVNVRLDRRSRILNHDDKIIICSGNEAEQKLELSVLDF